MNHALAIYTSLFLSIIYLTVSIWSSDIRKAEGEALALLVVLGVLSIKVAIDDYVHFQATFANKERLHLSLWFSLAMYLLLAASAANAATQHVVLGEILLGIAMVLGLAWIALSKGEKSPEDQARMEGWVAVNLLFILVLGFDVICLSDSRTDASVYLLYFLAVAVVFDAARHGTLKRLAEL